MVTAQDFINVMHITDTPTQMEYVLDLAIDSLNICGTNLSNMSGEAGSKTVTLTSKQRGGVFQVAHKIYYTFWKPAGTGGGTSEAWSVGGLSGSATTTTDIMSNPEVWGLVESIGAKLASTSEGIAFIVAEDSS